MRLLYVSSGQKTLSDLNPSIVSAFKKLSKDLTSFSFAYHYTEQEKDSELIRKMKEFKPDYVVNFGHTTHDIVDLLTPFNVPVGLWVVNDPYSMSNYEKLVGKFDFMITQDSGMVEFYKQIKKKPCIHLPLATNPSNYYPMDLEKKYDVCFIGNAWPGRIPFLDKLIPHLSKRNFILIGKGWHKLKNYHLIQHNILEKTIEPDEVSRIYNQTKITLNIHRDRNDVNKNPYNLPAYTPNNRTFDIAAAKAFQVTTHRKDLEKYYNLDKEIVSYHDHDDLLQKIDLYLQKNERRENIANLAYLRTLREHTYYARLQELIDKIKIEL
ncbi:CgeB family protein [Pseudalkalibacillus caeni]|uniref:Spore protein YkvP/CgeB glycosyl transferase-like domain-containing protein n=1 Tax=Exobacillus caeni TaxID=2574798 RepID=A0A5R9F3I3_9BACL|nr:glycosyltransferase [Pseudalkalibacillus caeni]TLS36896.1 hypothetical protein FCL54_13145 [Pseudalkalibacillus caeni]